MLPDLGALVTEVRSIAAESSDCGSFWADNWIRGDDGEIKGHGIIGRALLALGATADDFSAGAWVLDLYSNDDPRAVWLQRVQHLDAVGALWGYAVRRADEGPVLRLGRFVCVYPIEVDGDPELTV
jgi:hypothetical protein